MSISSKIQSLETLRKVIEKEQVTKRNAQKELEQLLLQIEDIGIYTEGRALLNQKIKQKKDFLKNIEDTLQEYNQFFTFATTFSEKLFLPFIRDYLSYREKEKYVVLDAIEENSAISYKTIPHHHAKSSYTIITTPENKQKIDKQNQMLGNFYSIKDYLSKQTDRKYICLDTSSHYTLLQGEALHPSYIKYFYLKNLGYDLVDLKLQNPFLNDSNRIEMLTDKIYQKKAW